MGQAEIFDRVNLALNEKLGLAIVYDTGTVLIKTGADGETLRGVFTDESVDVNGDGTVISTFPQIIVRGADLSGVKPAHGHRIRAGTDEYEVFEVRPDDSGAWLLALKMVGEAP